MKITHRDLESFVKSPNPAARVILVYGPDNGLVKERLSVMGKTVAPDLSDPFNVIKLNTSGILDDPARLSDEANAMSMMGGDRLIWVEEGTDKLTPTIKSYLENPSPQSLVIIEGGELGPRSSLRKLCESAKNAAAVPCYVEDDRDLGRLIREMTAEQSIQIEPDAIHWLSSHIAGNRARVRSEIEKLITYKGQASGPITIQDTMEICGATGTSSLDDLAQAVGAGQTAKAIKHFEKLLGEGVAFIAILRSLQNHFKRLHQARSAMDAGAQADMAMKKLAPPIFFKHQNAFRSQLNRWPSQKISTALLKLMQIEAECKKTGNPAETLCAQTILGLSKMVR